MWFLCCLALRCNVLGNRPAIREVLSSNPPFMIKGVCEN